MKKHVCICLDAELHAEAKKRSLCLSAIFSEHLRNFLILLKRQEEVNNENKENQPGQGEGHTVVTSDKSERPLEVLNLPEPVETQCAPPNPQGSEGVPLGAMERDNLVCEASQVQPSDISPQ